MSKWKKADGGREHRERGQTRERKHLGFLEKKQDYKKRADRYHKRQDYLRNLEKKAAERNPDEFYYGMAKKQTRSGVHVEVTGHLTHEEVSLMKSQDKGYVAYQ
ncbi:small-subunit processome, Utp11, partial [Kipferlia bialata]|eukprot:g12132.t1